MMMYPLATKITDNSGGSVNKKGQKVPFCTKYPVPYILSYLRDNNIIYYI